MSTNEESTPTSENKTPAVSPGNYSPVTVTVKDTVGALFLGVFAVLFWVGWMRAEKRYSELKSQIGAVDGNHPLDAR